MIVYHNWALIYDLFARCIVYSVDIFNKHEFAIAEI